MRTRSDVNLAWIPKALPVRRWQARQWHMEIRIGSPSAVRRSCPQLQAASRVGIVTESYGRSGMTFRKNVPVAEGIEIRRLAPAEVHEQLDALARVLADCVARVAS